MEYDGGYLVYHKHATYVAMPIKVIAYLTIVTCTMSCISTAIA